MSKHIFNTFRKFVLSAAFKAMPLRSADIVEPEPLNNPVHPEQDTWLFDTSPTIEARADDLGHAMGRLVNVLGSLHTVVSHVSTQAPMRASVQTETVFGAIWSDSLLFDGEPAARMVEATADLGPDADFLFGDAPQSPVHIPSATYQPQAAL